MSQELKPCPMLMAHNGDGSKTLGCTCPAPAPSKVEEAKPERCGGKGFILDPGDGHDCADCLPAHSESEEIELGIRYADLQYPTRQQMRLEIVRLAAALRRARLERVR